MNFKYYLISVNLSILVWPAANILDSTALGEQTCFAAYDVFANWALLSFEFYTYLSHHVRSVQKQRECMAAWILMEMKLETKSLKVMRKRKIYLTVGTILKKRKEL